MKKITLLFSLLFIGLTVISCNSDDDSNNLPEGDYLTYTLPQGEQVIMSRFAITGEQGGANYVLTDGGVLSINAAKDNSHIKILFPFNGLGTYNDVTFSVDNGNTYFNVDENYQSNGTVTISEVDIQNKTISGTFSFTGYNEGNTLEVTQGEFNKLPYIGTLPTDPDKNFMRMKEDGKHFVLGVLSGGEFIYTIPNEDGTNSMTGRCDDYTNDRFLEVTISYENDIVPGTYPIDGTDDAVNIVYNIRSYIGENVLYESQEGSTLTVLSNENGKVTGEFEFKNYNPDGSLRYHFTDGKFQSKIYN